MKIILKKIVYLKDFREGSIFENKIEKTVYKVNSQNYNRQVGFPDVHLRLILKKFMIVFGGNFLLMDYLSYKSTWWTCILAVTPLLILEIQNIQLKY